MLDDLDYACDLWIALWVALAMLLHVPESLLQSFILHGSVSVLQMLIVAQDQMGARW